MARAIGSKNRKPLGLDQSKKQKQTDKPSIDSETVNASALLPQPPEDGGALPVPSPLADANPIPDQPGKSGKVTPVDPLYEGRIAELETELAIMRGRITTSTVQNLDELMKDPTFGTTSYIMVPIGTDIRTKRSIMAALSVFPDLIDPNQIDVKTKRPKLMAPDHGISRREADTLRKSETIMIEITVVTNFETREEDFFTLSIKDAVRKKREEYLKKRLFGDKAHMKQLIMVK